MFLEPVSLINSSVENLDARPGVGRSADAARTSGSPRLSWWFSTTPVVLFTRETHAKPAESNNLERPLNCRLIVSGGSEMRLRRFSITLGSVLLSCLNFSSGRIFADDNYPDAEAAGHGVA